MSVEKLKSGRLQLNRDITDMITTYDTSNLSAYQQAANDDDRQVVLIRVGVLNRLLQVGVPLCKLRDQGFRDLLVHEPYLTGGLDDYESLLNELFIETTRTMSRHSGLDKAALADLKDSKRARLPVSLIFDGTSDAAELEATLVRYVPTVITRAIKYLLHCLQIRRFSALRTSAASY